ncbi:MAG: hypothetical protein CL676_00795 [Bdellovibrionaceae bacterium]|nr:hypothetical protein [Pseudobdellovibrionaceae bacterium]
MIDLAKRYLLPFPICTAYRKRKQVPFGETHRKTRGANLRIDHAIALTKVLENCWIRLNFLGIKEDRTK